jgi:hypothetical protein
VGSHLVLAFAGFHAYRNYPALEHESAWVDRALTSTISFGFGIAVLAAVGLHGLLGLAGWLRHRREVARGETTRDWGLTFQIVTGTLVLGFLTYHVVQLWSELGHPVTLVVYVAGVCAFAFHLGHGLARFVARKLPNLVGRAIGGVFGFVLLLVFAQLVARFALGEALIPALS